MIIHGECKSKLNKVWRNMKDRCYNPKNKRYSHYGGRNIIVCDSWKNSYIEFRDWAIKNGYKEGLSIDRINNDGNYEPGNCRWVNSLTQNNNFSRKERALRNAAPRLKCRGGLGKGFCKVDKCDYYHCNNDDGCVKSHLEQAEKELAGGERMNYCTKCGKPTDNGMICEDCIVNNSPWLLAMKIKENDLEAEIDRLKAENAELRARLDKAVELPCKVGDIIYEATSTCIYEWKVESIYLHKDRFQANCVNKNNYKMHWNFVKSDYCNEFEGKGRIRVNRLEAEKKLAELKGEK